MISPISSLGARDVPQSDMDATQGAWNLEAPEGTGGRKAEAFETARELPPTLPVGDNEVAAFFDILTPPTAGE